MCAVLIMDIEEGCKMMSHMAWTFISSSEMGPNAEICYHGYKVGRLLLRRPITIICKRKLLPLRSFSVIALLVSWTFCAVWSTLGHKTVPFGGSPVHLNLSKQ